MISGWSVQTFDNPIERKYDMDLLNGLSYNLRGLQFALKNGKLLLWGLVRFLLVLIVMFILSGLILAYHGEILDLLWMRPESPWIVWLWHLVSWLVSLFLVGLSAVFSYLVSQILFSVLIMDHMSRITELKVTGHIKEPKGVSFWQNFFHLIKQEIPRTIVPIILSLLIMIFGWVIAFLGPIMAVVSSALAIVFLSWDNTDLIPARRLVPFKKRWIFLMRRVLFHLGFGLPFLVPVLNLFFLSFAPVGATLYYLDKHDEQRQKTPPPPEPQAA